MSISSPLTSQPAPEPQSGRGVKSSAGSLAPPLWLWVFAGAGAIYAVVLNLMLRHPAAGEVSPHFDPAPVLAAPLAVQIHLATAVAAFLLGVLILALPKGRGLHKPAGWIWVGLMVTTAVSSFFIQRIMDGGFSPIHALSAWTLVALPMGIAAIRTKRVKAHRITMTSLFLAGLVTAGMFTFLPGRLMWQVFFAA